MIYYLIKKYMCSVAASIAHVVEQTWLMFRQTATKVMRPPLPQSRWHDLQKDETGFYDFQAV